MSLELARDSSAFSAEAAGERLRERVVPVFEADGWRVVTLQEPQLPAWCLVRDHGAIRQRIRIGSHARGGGLAVALRTDRTSEVVDMLPVVLVNVSLGFSCAAIAGSLRALLPEDAEWLDADRPSQGAMRDEDFRPLLRTVFPVRELDGESIGGMEQLDAWIAYFLAWYGEHGRPAFEACRDLRSLNRLLHTPWSLQASVGRMGFHEMLATLVLVHFADDPQVTFLDWLGVVRKSQVDLRSKANSYEKNPQWFKDGPPREVRENEIVDRLVERIRRRRPPNTRACSKISVRSISRRPAR